MSNGLGLMIESLVAVLLLLTIAFCIVLNRRLKKLKADEQALKGTISELITATEIAERATLSRTFFCMKARNGSDARSNACSGVISLASKGRTPAS
jgi:hypothetical protein